MDGGQWGGRQHDDPSWSHPRVAMTLYGLSAFCWFFVIALAVSIDFGHMPTQLAQPGLTVLGVLSVLVGIAYWSAADKELRGLAPRTFWGGLACLIGAEVAGHFAR